MSTRRWVDVTPRRQALFSFRKGEARHQRPQGDSLISPGRHKHRYERKLQHLHHDHEGDRGGKGAENQEGW